MLTGSTWMVPTRGTSRTSSCVEDLVRGLPGDVGEHDVAGRLQGGTPDDGQAADRRVVVDDLEHALGQVAGDGDAQVQHRHSLSHSWGRVVARASGNEALLGLDEDLADLVGEQDGDLALLEGGACDVRGGGEQEVAQRSSRSG